MAIFRTKPVIIGTHCVEFVTRLVVCWTTKSFNPSILLSQNPLIPLSPNNKIRKKFIPLYSNPEEFLFSSVRQYFLREYVKSDQFHFIIIWNSLILISAQFHFLVIWNSLILIYWMPAMFHLHRTVKNVCLKKKTMLIANFLPTCSSLSLYPLFF